MEYVAVLGMPVAAFICLSSVLWVKLSSLKQARTSQSVISFPEYFSGEGIPESLCREVYRYLQKGVCVRDFPVEPKDDLAKIYGLYDEDMVDAAVEIAEVCGDQFSSDGETAGRQFGNIVSIEYLVRFLFITGRNAKKTTNTFRARL